MKFLPWFKKAPQVRSVSVFGLTIIIPNELDGLTPHNSHGSQEMSLSRSPYGSQGTEITGNGTPLSRFTTASERRLRVSSVSSMAQPESREVPETASVTGFLRRNLRESNGFTTFRMIMDDLVPDTQTSRPKRATMTIETGRLIWPTVQPRRSPSQVANVDRSGSNTQVPGMSATNSLGTSSEPRGCSAEIETTAVTADSRSNLITWLHRNSQLPNTSRGDWGRFGGVQAS